MIKRLCIIGVGLIGGSLARALRAAGGCKEIVGCGRNAAQLDRARELGVIDRGETDPARAVDGADMVVVAVPVGAVAGVFKSISGHLAPGAVITDVGSTKGSVVLAAREAFGSVPPNLVPGHPIAGTERNGVEASFAELYRDRRVILTPLPETERDAVERVISMWRATGALVEEMGVEHHDEVLAATSHLPHLLAFTLVDSLAALEEEAEVFRYAAGGFRDFTRIASSDPRMWHDISLANRDALLSVITHFRENLDGLTEAIEKGDSERILALFSSAKSARDRFCEQDPKRRMG